MRRFRDRKNAGFNLAELMIVIAIIGVLAAVGFIAVSYYMRILKQLEYDAVAKEMFITAQNHLSMAHNEGYLSAKEFGHQEGDSDVYYYVVNGSNSSFNDDVDKEDSLLSLILPFGSIEDKARSHGSYILRYDKASARVLDVFYSEQNTTRYGHNFASLESEEDRESTPLMELRDEDDKMKRRYYANEGGNKVSVIGHYGGDDIKLIYGDKIGEPYIRVDNVEKLKVTVRIDNLPADGELVLIVKGIGNDHRAVLKEYTKISDNEYQFILDDITTPEKHFHDLFPGFTAGEDITVQAMASKKEENDGVITVYNAPRSVIVKTNSIFGDGSDNSIADIANIRHLENLDSAVSSVDYTVKATNYSAEQSVDLDWNDFKTKIGGASVTIYGSSNSALTGSNYYHPVELPIDYDGTSKKISNVDIGTTGNAGLFSKLVGRTVKNIELIGFQVSSSGAQAQAGTLAGLADSSIISNVVAHESKTGRSSSVSSDIVAGGLIGNVTNGSSVSYCAAALTVEGKSVAGGLAGLAASSTIDNSYAAGHTDDGKYQEDAVDVKAKNSNGVAGGLIGRAEQMTIRNSYSTCCVDGTTAGGFIGYSNANTVSNSYAVGHVILAKDIDDASKKKKGAFAGEDSSSSFGNDCSYLKIANNKELNAVGNNENNTSIRAADETKSNFNSLIGRYFRNESDGTDAAAYDQFLIDTYNNKYLYKSIRELLNISDGTAFDYLVSKHFGDWPVYETYIENIPR